MIHFMRSLPVFLAALSALTLSAYTECRADEDGDEIPFKEAEFFIEYNASAGDTGVQVFLDDDNWRKITISDPNDKKLFVVKGKSTLGRQGLTELFFESVEPELAVLPIEEFLDRFPEGDYKFEGIRNDWIELESEVEFTHIISCAPEVMPGEGEILDPYSEVFIEWEEVVEVVDPAATDAEGETMCAKSDDLVIDAYQVIVEGLDGHLIVDLSNDARKLTVPAEMILT